METFLKNLPSCIAVGGAVYLAAIGFSEFWYFLLAAWFMYAIGND